TDNDGFGDCCECIGFCTDAWRITVDTDRDGMPDGYEDEYATQNNQRFAILCGHYRSNYLDFWHDVTGMYDVLKYVFNYRDENIFVFYTPQPPPTDYRHQEIVDYGFNKAYIKEVFNFLANTTKSSDRVLFYFSTHGWTDLIKVSEPYPSGSEISKSEFAIWASNISASQIYIFDSCGSGSLIDISPNVSVISSTERLHFAHRVDGISGEMGHAFAKFGEEKYPDGTYKSGYNNKYVYRADLFSKKWPDFYPDADWENNWAGEFSLYFIAAFRRAIIMEESNKILYFHLIASEEIDKNKDNRITIEEAFNYSTNKNSQLFPWSVFDIYYWDGTYKGDSTQLTDDELLDKSYKAEIRGDVPDKDTLTSPPIRWMTVDIQNPQKYITAYWKTSGRL
ncbi:MAG: hypothetical protein ACP5LE_07980, partial [Thermoplasmata archaeon]